MGWIGSPGRCGDGSPSLVQERRSRLGVQRGGPRPAEATREGWRMNVRGIAQGAVAFLALATWGICAGLWLARGIGN